MKKRQVRGGRGSWRGKSRVNKVVMSRDVNLIYNCWLGQWKYMKLDGMPLYQKWAHGDGDVARHLCGDARCINPLHLVRGTWLENAQDEIDIRHFTVRAFERILDYNRSESGVSKELQFYVLVPQVAMKYGMSTPTDAISYGRHLFRINFVRELMEKMDKGDIKTAARMKLAFKALKLLESRQDVEITYVMEVM